MTGLLRVVSIATPLLLPATSAGAATRDASSDLRRVRTVEIRSTQWRKFWPEKLDELRRTVAEAIPSVVVESSDGADLIIDYEEKGDADQGTAWLATLFRLGCQSPNFGEPPSPVVDGRCPANVFVQIGMGSMSGTAPAGQSGVNDFAFTLRDAILGFAASP